MQPTQRECNNTAGIWEKKTSKIYPKYPRLLGKGMTNLLWIQSTAGSTWCLGSTIHITGAKYTSISIQFRYSVGQVHPTRAYRGINQEGSNCCPELTMCQATNNANYKPNTWDSQANFQRLIKQYRWRSCFLACQGGHIHAFSFPTLPSALKHWNDRFTRSILRGVQQVIWRIKYFMNQT